MSTDSGDLVREVGNGGDERSHRFPGGLVLVVVGLAAGLAFGVLIVAPEETVAGLGESTVPTAAVTTSVADVPDTTATSGPVLAADDYEEQIDDLERALANAQQELFELGLTVDPASYAVAVGCNSSIGAQYPVDWQTNSQFAGPVAFYQLTERLPAPGWAELFAVVEASDSVTMVIPESERSSYSLIWNPQIWQTVDGDYTVSDGDPAVTLQACDGYATVFIGGFVSLRPYCAPLDLYFGDSTEPHQVGLPFGGASCPDEEDGFATPERGSVPDVTGLSLRNARLAIRLADLDPVVVDGESLTPDSLVWAQAPAAGETQPEGTVIGLRTCQAGGPTLATFQQRLNSRAGSDQIVLSHGWVTPATDTELEDWYFVSAHVTGGLSDGEIATWVVPPWVALDDPQNTPGITFFLNDAAGSLGFGDDRFNPETFGGETWTDFAGALESQLCVELAQTRS